MVHAYMGGRFMCMAPFSGLRERGVRRAASVPVRRACFLAQLCRDRAEMRREARVTAFLQPPVAEQKLDEQAGFRMLGPGIPPCPANASLP